MDSQYIQAGDYWDYTPSSAVAAGQVVLLNATVTIAPRDIAANADGSLALSGIWKVQKTTGEAWAAGEPLYWVAGTSKFTTTASTNKKAGVASKAAASGDTTGYLALNRNT